MSARRKYDNAVVDFVVEGGVTLRAAGGGRFKTFVLLLTKKYWSSSTRKILRRIAELHYILKSALAKFLIDLSVAIPLTMNGWSSRDLKGYNLSSALRRHAHEEHCSAYNPQRHVRYLRRLAL